MSRSLRFPPGVSRFLLRFGALLLLVQTLVAWAILLGLWQPNGAFADFPSLSRNLVVVCAVLCPVAAIGSWFVSEWGPVLWAAVVVALGIAFGLGTPIPALVAIALIAHATLFAAWLLTAARVERRAVEPSPFER